MSELPPPAVFDCTIFLQALANRSGPAYACWQLVESGHVTLYLGPDVLAEVTDELNRPELHQKLKSLTPKKVQVYLAKVRTHATFIDDVPKRFTYPRDPKDEPYLNLAIATSGRYLVTRDNDMLDLMNENSDQGRAFRQEFPELMILGPVELLREVRPSQLLASRKCAGGGGASCVPRENRRAAKLLSSHGSSPLRKSGSRLMQLGSFVTNSDSAKRTSFVLQNLSRSATKAFSPPRSEPSTKLTSRSRISWPSFTPERGIRSRRNSREPGQSVLPDSTDVGERAELRVTGDQGQIVDESGSRNDSVLHIRDSGSGNLLHLECYLLAHREHHHRLIRVKQHFEKLRLVRGGDFSLFCQVGNFDEGDG